MTEHPERRANRNSKGLRRSVEGPSDEDQDEALPKPVREDESTEESSDTSRESDPPQDPRLR